MLTLNWQYSQLAALLWNYSTQGIVVSRDFLRAQRGVVKRFLKVYIEGIKIFKTDRELSIATLGRYIKTNDREVLAKTYDFYRDAWESVPTVRRERIQHALDGIPEGKNAKLNVDNLIDNSLIHELDKEGFLREIDGRQALNTGVRLTRRRLLPAFLIAVQRRYRMLRR
jgi:ABC-type nitrate/sulfonate/bicarbonate transport system substrate-binding protein